MKLCNVNIVGQGNTKHISVKNGMIVAVYNEKPITIDKSELRIDFDDALAFPGLINSHDHLDFNLFPKTGNTVYKNYVEWGIDIHSKNKDAINSVLKIPRDIRIEWGIYKNLINGVTTVVNHGHYPKLESLLVHVFQDCYSLHSVRLENMWKLKLNRPFPKYRQYVIHIGEGTDSNAYDEINELIRWNFFRRKLIGIHGVAMNLHQAKKFEALIWCPDSNFFLLNKTAKVDELIKETKILFGTDSTLSADWNLWAQLRLAQNTGLLTDEELFASLTLTPSSVWKLKNKGQIIENKRADIVIAKNKNRNANPLTNFFELNPSDILLTLHNGEIVLFDESLYAQLKDHIEENNFSKIWINNKKKYVKGRLDELVLKIKEFAPDISLPFSLV